MACLVLDDSIVFLRLKWVPILPHFGISWKVQKSYKFPGNRVSGSHDLSGELCSAVHWMVPSLVVPDKVRVLLQ